MDRARLVSSFGAVSLALLLVQVVNQVGYSSVQALALLAAIGVAAVLAIGITSAAAGAFAYLVYYVVNHILHDSLVTAVILATIAAAATLVHEGKGAWRR